MEKKTGQTPLREIEIFGIPALFTDQDIPPDELSTPVLKCKKTPRKKCRIVAEVREKR